MNQKETCMKIRPFALERYFAQYEFNTRYLLSSSECQPLSLQALLSWADDETRQMYDALRLGYTQSTGHPMLLDEIAGLYQALTPQNILTIIPEEGIFIAVNTMVASGDHMIVTYPGYQSLYEIGHAIGCDVDYWQARFDEQGAHFDLDELKSLVQPNTRLLVINFPHNPTGYIPTGQYYREILQFAADHGLYVLSDEMYRYLQSPGIESLPFACDLYDRAVSLFGLSKSFALPGLRMGWLATQDHGLMDEFKSYRDYLSICSAAPSEILAIMALRAKKVILQQNIDRVERNKVVARQFFDQHTEWFTYYEPQAGSIGYPQLHPSMDIVKVSQEMAASYETMVLPCTVYGQNNNRFRIGYGKDGLEQGLVQFGQYLLDHK